MIVEFDKLIHKESRRYEMSRVLEFLFSSDYSERQQQNMLSIMEQTIDNSHVTLHQQINNVNNITDRIEAVRVYLQGKE